MRVLIASIALGAASCVALAGGAGAAAVPAAGPPGQATYLKLCKSCHGENGHGNAAKATALKLDPKLLDLGREEALKLTAEERREVVAKGKGKMPAYGERLGAAEIDAVSAYADGLVKAHEAK